MSKLYDILRCSDAVACFKFIFNGFSPFSDFLRINILCKSFVRHILCIDLMKTKAPKPKINK